MPVDCAMPTAVVCLVQSRASVAHDAVLVNSIVGDNVHISSAAAITHCHLTSPVHINSGCVVTGLNDSDIPVSDPAFIFYVCVQFVDAFFAF